MADVRWKMDDARMKNEKFLALQATRGRAATAVACAVCLAVSVLLLGVSGTMAVGLIAWLRG